MLPGLKKRVFTFHDVLMYVALARKHARLAILLFCFSVCCGLAYYCFARPVYYSKSLIRVESSRVPLDRSTAANIYPDSSLQTLVGILQSPEVTMRTARKLGFSGNYETLLKEKIKLVRLRPNTAGDLDCDVWVYSYGWVNKWAETMVTEYLAYRDEHRKKQREQIVGSYSKFMEEISDIMTQSEAKKKKYLDEAQAAETDIELKKLQRLPSQLVEVEQRVQDFDAIRSRIQKDNLDLIAKISLLAAANRESSVELGQVVDVSKSTSGNGSAEGSSIVVVPSMLAPTTWEAAEHSLRDVEHQIQQASEIYLSGHPKIIDLEKKRKEVLKSLELEFQIQLRRFDVLYQSLQQKRTEFHALLPQYQQLLEKSSRIQNQAVLLDAGQQWKNLYSLMAKDVEARNFTADKDHFSLFCDMIVESNPMPISPNSTRTALGVLGMAALLIVGVPFLIEYLDHTVTNIEMAEQAFKMRGLGIVPLVDSGTGGESFFATSDEQSRNQLLENFRVIRSNLVSVGALSKHPQVIMVTSSVPREGKTMLASNLAASFALSGTKTLLLDTDLRRGRLHRLFGIRKEPGISNALSGSASFEQIIRNSSIPNLWIAPSGKHSDTCVEMLGSPMFEQMITKLRSQYDCIIVDTPPVLGLSETSMLQRAVDGVLFVIWSGYTPISNARTAIDTLQNNGANFYGFVLNRLDLSASTNYYQYYYYTNDYYRDYRALPNS